MGSSYNTTVIQELIYEATRTRGSQTLLANELGTTPQTVNKWRSGQTCPEPWRWPAIEDALGLDRGHIMRIAMTGQVVTIDGSKVSAEDLARVIDQALAGPEAEQVRTMLADKIGTPRRTPTRQRGRRS